MYLGNLFYVRVSCRLDTCIRQKPLPSQIAVGFENPTLYIGTPVS